MMFSASAASVSARHRHRVARHDVAGASARGSSAPRSMCRRRSPSVMMPSSVVVAVDDAGHAQPLARHLVDHVAHPRVGAARSGTACRACISASTRISRLPSLPPGCRLAKSSWRNPFSTSSVIASASPMRQRRGRARRRHQVHRARFLGDAAVERDVGRLRQRRAPAAGDRDQLGAEPADRLEQPQQSRRSRRCRTAPRPRRRAG